MTTITNGESGASVRSKLNAALAKTDLLSGTVARNLDTLADQAHVAAAIAALVASSPAALDTLNELAAALGSDPNFAATMTAALAGKAPLASPALTGNPTAPTQAPGNNTTRLATTAFVAAAVAAGSKPATVGSGAPATAPAVVGLLYVDDSNYNLYYSKGVATVSDWVLVIDNDAGATLSPKATPVLADEVMIFDSANGAAAVVATWTQIVAALKLVVLDANGRLVNPKSTYTSFDGGTVSTGTYTPTSVDGNVQHYANNGAHTLAPPANPGTFLIEIVNGASAGAITTSGFTKVSGDAFTTTNGHKFQCSITRTNSTSHLNIKAMQ
jgi:hypothetical protein